MKIEVHNRCSDFKSYRAARVKSLFNAETGCNFDLEAELPIEGTEWSIGVIVGPSGSGKTSLGRKVFARDLVHKPGRGWKAGEPIIDCIARDGGFDAVTNALSAVGLGNVPAWLRPYSVLSNGEKFRADLARIICEAPRQIVVDEFTSVVDRQIAKFGALAFQKAWRRNGGQCVLLSCHYDILEWVEPDWIFDTATRRFSGGRLWRRPPFDLEIRQTDGSYWPLFEPHHYLKLPRMIAAEYYVGSVDGEPVSHVCTGPRFEIGMMRACRLVVMPEWQGAGVGMRFLNAICQRQLEGGNRWGRPCPTLFHTSHPGLCAALRRDSKWKQVSAMLHGSHRGRSRDSIRKSHAKYGCKLNGGALIGNAGYGGHFRAVQGFKYTGA
ncbi:MAG TPA: hypothetical protein VK474_02650 [Chthoniobacterales bacterium]|nr:hypothetical protein [Chthoniobacterales bacterium]